ncbi:MAG: amino acid ABC transporter permease [Hyphomicrobium sp.]|uniref:amino acid ABC transporter permease n=1 Tax=Hyphomicrobium sp. TaxID=82 RepID=UPI003D0A8BD2
MDLGDLERWRERKTWVDAAYDPAVRGWVLQGLLLLGLVLLATQVVLNTAANLEKQNIASGFDFLSRTAGFDVSQTLVPYSRKSSYGAAFLVGLVNTLLVATLGIGLATVLGFALGIARGSPNRLAAKLALGYVELVRNVPLLLQLLVWYVAVLRALPLPQDAAALPGGARFDTRGLHLPRLWIEIGSAWVVVALLLAGLAAAWLWWRGRERRPVRRGQSDPLRLAGSAAILLLVTLLLVIGAELHIVAPALGRFNWEGGVDIEPEFLALLIGLSTYTAAFIAEIVRAGLDGVPQGQWEAAQALGLSRRQALRFVILPQALRIIIPPLTNQYLNLTKNSSLAVAIGYPDLVSVFSGTVLNQTGQAVEVILITMAVYLALSLATALAMSWFNARTSWAER